MVVFLENQQNGTLALLPAKVQQCVGKIDAESLGHSQSCTRTNIKSIGGEGQGEYRRWATTIHVGKDGSVFSFPSVGDLYSTRRVNPKRFGEFRFST